MLFQTVIYTYLVTTHNNEVIISICDEICEYPMLETKVPRVCIVVVWASNCTNSKQCHIQGNYKDLTH